jgi:hypothetical protein
MPAVEAKLGSATARLYAEVSALVERSSSAGDAAKPTRLAMARIALSVLCGDYHDIRAGSPRPKLDLVDALRRVPGHASVSWDIESLAQRALAGEFSDEFPVRSISAPAATPAPIAETPDPIYLAPNEWRVFAWLYRYVELYGMPPLHRELTDGLGIPAVTVADILRRLETKGAVVSIGGRRGWIPVRSP